MPDIPEDIIQYVEETEGLRFKKKPRLIYNNVGGGRNTVNYNNERVGDVVEEGREKIVTQSSVNVSNVGVDKFLMLHEARENVNFQNRENYSKQEAHQSALAHEKADVQWLKERGHMREVPIDSSHKNWKEAGQTGRPKYQQTKRVETEAKRTGCCPQKRSNGLFGVSSFKPIDFNKNMVNFNFNSKALNFGFGNNKVKHKNIWEL
jgi:hypothetical protein